MHINRLFLYNLKKILANHTFSQYNFFLCSPLKFSSQCCAFRNGHPNDKLASRTRLTIAHYSTSKKDIRQKKLLSRSHSFTQHKFLGSLRSPPYRSLFKLMKQVLDMKRRIRNAKPRPLLKALFRGEDLRGYVEANLTRTLDNFVGEK